MSAAGPSSVAAGAGSGRLRLAATAVATAIVIVGLAVLPLITPFWFYPAQERAHADAWTGWPMETVRRVTGEVLVDLVIGPPDFDQEVDGVPVFDEQERGHFRDVRTMLLAFGVVVAIAAVIVVVSLWSARGRPTGWRGMALGAKVLTVAVIALGIFAVVAFDTAFGLFHALLFPGGNYTFDPATERMVQLFPESLWYETAMAVGVVIVALSMAIWALASWRVRRIERAAGRAAALVSDGAAP